MISHDKEYKELINIIRDEKTWKRLRPGVFSKRRFVSVNAQSFIVLECLPDKLILSLNSLFPEIGFNRTRDCAEGFFNPYSYDMHVKYTPEDGLVYTKLSCSGIMTTTGKVEQLLIEIPDNAHMTMDAYTKRIEDDINDGYNSMSAQEQSFYMLSGGEMRGREILKQLHKLHHELELTCKRAWKRKRKMRIFEIAIGQWVEPTDFPHKYSKWGFVGTTAFNFVITYHVVQVYLQTLLLGIFLL